MLVEGAACRQRARVYQQSAGVVTSMMLTTTLAVTQVTCAHRDAHDERALLNGHVAPAHSSCLHADARTVLLPDLVEAVQLWRLPGTPLPSSPPPSLGLCSLPDSNTLSLMLSPALILARSHLSVCLSARLELTPTDCNRLLT